MPPLYQWLETHTKKSLEILRSFDEFRSEPTEEEAKAAGFTEEEIKEAKWEKLIGKNITVNRGDGWGSGKKGSW